MPVTEFDPPERFLTDTVGPPGQRTFFLQASRGDRVMSVSLEKEQVSVLGQRLAELLDQVAEEESTAQAAAAVADNAPLDTPIEDEFRVRSLSIAWDAGRHRVVLEAHEQPVDEDLEEEQDELEDPVPGQTMRVVLDPARARAFAERCATVVARGRPNCPFCGNPLDPEGHVCPRANGYRR